MIASFLLKWSSTSGFNKAFKSDLQLLERVCLLTEIDVCLQSPCDLKIYTNLASLGHTLYKLPQIQTEFLMSSLMKSIILYVKA